MASQIIAPQFAMLSTEQCQEIHRASLEILRHTGVRLHHEAALALVGAHGVIIQDGNLAFLPAALVEWAIRQAPSCIALCRRRSAEVVAPLEGRRVSFAPGLTARATWTPARRAPALHHGGCGRLCARGGCRSGVELLHVDGHTR